MLTRAVIGSLDSDIYYVRGDRLDNEILIKQFDEIETKVERVLSALQALEAKNVELKRQVKSLEETLSQKETAEGSFNEEKRQIRERVDGLLKKLSDFSNNNS